MDCHHYLILSVCVMGFHLWHQKALHRNPGHYPHHQASVFWHVLPFRGDTCGCPCPVLWLIFSETALVGFNVRQRN